MLKEKNFLLNSGLGVDLKLFQIIVISLSRFTSHIAADNNESYRFLLVYHRIFNIPVKQLDYILLFMNISKYRAKNTFSCIFSVINTI